MMIRHRISVDDSSRSVLVCFILHLLIFLNVCFLRLTSSSFFRLVFDISHINLFRELIARDTILECVVDLLVIVFLGRELLELIIFPCLISHGIPIALHKSEFLLRETQDVNHDAFQNRAHLFLIVGALGP